MGNINDHRKGARVISRETTRRRLAADFPGWGAANYEAHLLPLTGGLLGTVTSVESHGSNPWTRYSVRFDDGTSASGLVDGADFDFIAGGAR